MIPGERRIRGGVRGAGDLSNAVAGPAVRRLFQSALLVGARVRSETGLARGAASAASAAVAVAGKIFTHLAGRAPPVRGARHLADPPHPCLPAAGARRTLAANLPTERAPPI